MSVESLNTNILIYAHDRKAGSKHDKALAATGKRPMTSKKAEEVIAISAPGLSIVLSTPI